MQHTNMITEKAAYKRAAYYLTNHKPEWSVSKRGATYLLFEGADFLGAFSLEELGRHLAVLKPHEGVIPGTFYKPAG